MPAPSLFDQLREQSRPSFEPEPLDTGRIVKDVDTRLAKESADYAKGQEQAAKDAAKQQVQGLREKGYTVVHDEAGNPAPLTATNGEPVRRKAGSRIHVGEQTGTYYEPDLQKGGLKPAVGQKKTDKNGRIIEDFGGGLIKDLGEDPAWAKRKEDKTLLTKAEAAIRDKMLAPPPEGMDVVKTKKDYFAAQKALAKAEKNLEDDKTDKDYLAAHAKAKADLDAIAPQNEAINQWSKSKTGLHRQLAQIKTHRELLGEGAFTDENRKQWQSVIAPPAAPAPAQVAPATPAPATVTPPAPTAGTSGQAALQASKEPMSESPTAAPATTGTVATPTRTQAPSPAVSPVQGQGTVAAPAVGVPSVQPITPASREQLVTPEAVADLSVADHNTAIQASDAALKQNAAAIQHQQDAINAPVAAVDAKLSAWQAKSQAALATGDAAISMMQLDGTMSPLFAASTKKELQDLYSERQEAEKKVASQLEELNGAWVAHQEDVDAHNQAVESLKGKITAQENERRSSIEKMREQPALAPYADKINALDKETAENNAKIDSASWDENAKEAARAGLKASHEAKLKDIQKGIEETVNPVVRLQKEQDFAEEYRQMKDTLDTGDVRGTDPKQVAKLKADLASKFNVSPDDFDKLANAAESRPYSVEDGKIKFAPANFDDAVTPDMTLKGFEQAVKDGVIDPKSAPEARAELQKANEEYQKLVAEAGGADKVKAALVGAGKGAAFMAGAELVGPVGAELGAKAGALVGPEGVPIGATIGSIAGALLGGVTAGAAYDKIRETAGEYFKAVNSFNAAAKLNPGVTQASELASFVVMPEGLLKPSLFVKEGLKAGLTPAVAKSVEGYAKLADIAADAVGEAGASAAIDSARNVAKLKEVLKAGTGSVGGAVAFTAGQYAFDAGRYAIADLVGIKHDELHAPTFGDLATNVGLGLLLHGKGLTFKDYSTEEVKSILTRAKVRSDAGIGIDADVHPQFVIDAFKAAGAPLDTSLLGKDVGPGKKGSKELGSYNEAEQNVRNMLKPLSPEEKAVYESAKKKTEELESSGAFAGKGVEFGGARQASVPKMFGKAEPVTTATVRPKGEKPTDTEPQSPNPDVPPNLPGGLPVEVKTAASDAEIEANLEHPDLNRVLTLRDIANGAKVSTMFEGQLNAVGLTHKGDKVVPITGKDAPSPAVQIDGKGNPIILQHAIDELRATFPATAEFVTMDEKQAREYFAQNGNADTSSIEPPVENAAPPTAEVAPEPRVEPTPSGEVAAKPVVPNPAAVAKGADIAATLGKQSATKIQEKLSPLHPKVTKVIDGMISAYGQRGVSIVKETTDAPSGIEFDPDSKKIILDLPKIQANTEGSTPDDTIAWVRDSVARHELVHLVSTTDKAVEQHLDNLWSQLSDEDKSASAKTYYKGARSKWDSDFRGKHEFLVQLVQAAEDGKLEPALLKILKGNSKSLFNTLRQLMDALIARLQRILTDPKHKAHEAAKKTLEAFKAARARLFAEPVGKVDTTSGLTDKGETEGDLTTGLARKTTNPAEGGQSKSGVGNRPAASNEAPDASSFASGVASKVADSGDVATVDVKAHEAAASPHNDLTPPTPAQIEADNYKVGKVRLAGEDISIETPAGAKRREEWPALKDHYGRILGTKGADGELLDIFIKEGTLLDWNGPVFVVNQNKPDGTFDETKAIAGASSVAEAREIYKRNYSKGWKGLGGIVKYDSLKDWVESDHSGKAVKKGVDVKPVNVKDGGMEIIPPPPIPQPTAEVGQPPAPPIPDLPSPYLASLVAKDAAHKILLDHVKQIFGEGAGARADGSKPNASEQEALNGIKKHAASQGWKWSDVQEVARKQNGLNSDFMEDNSHEARMLKSYRDTLAKAKDQATKSDALNAEAQAEIDAKNAEAKRLADEKAEAERKTREDERAAETERNLKFHDESVAKLPPVFVEKWKQDMSKKDRKALLNAIMLKTDNRNEPELVAALDRAPLPPAPPKSYGSRYIENHGIDGAITRIDHLRKRLDEENARKNRDPRTGENLADEIDRIANAIIDVEPAYDWTTNTVAKPATALVAETLRASRDTLFDLPPRKRSLSGMRDAVSKRLDELERQEANEEYPKDRMRKGGVQTSGEIVLRDNIDRLRTLLGKIETAMAPAGTGGVISAATQYSQASEAILAENRAKAQAAMDKRLADRKADVAAAEADGWEVKRFEEKSSKRGGRPFTGWEVTHNGQRVKYGFSTKGEADERMVQLHKAGVTRPKPTAEQNQATREELKAKGATSVVNKPLERAPAVPRSMNMAGETRHVSFKRTNPPQVAQPLVEKGVKITVPYGNGQSVEYSGKAYYLPGYEEYRIVTVPPKGSKSKSTKSWWTAYEQTTGLKIAESREVQGKPSSEQEVLQMALQIMRGKGKAFMDNAIQTTLDKQNESVVKAQETPEKPHISPEIAPVVERPYGPPDETGKSGTETREGKNPNEAKAPELMTPEEFEKMRKGIIALYDKYSLSSKSETLKAEFKVQMLEGELKRARTLEGGSQRGVRRSRGADKSESDLQVELDAAKATVAQERKAWDDERDIKNEKLWADVKSQYPEAVQSGLVYLDPNEGKPQVFNKAALASSGKDLIRDALRDKRHVSAPAVDAYKLTLPEGYVRDGDIYRYEPTNPTQSTTPAEGQSTGGVVEGEKEGSEAAPTEPALMTPEQLAAYEKAKALQNATEALARAKSGEDKPNVFINGAKSKAELVRMRTADVNDAISGSFGDIWNTMLDAAREKKPIAVHLLDGLSKTRPETEPLHAQAERNLFENGYVKEGALYVHKDSPVITTPAVDAYKLTLPEGYVRDGDVYRYEKPSDEGQFSVYPHGSRFAVQQTEKRQVFGDHLFDTREEAEKQAEAQKKLAAANKEFFDKQEAKAKAEADALALKEKSLNGYLDSLGLNPMQRGKLVKVLNVPAYRRSISASKIYNDTRYSVAEEMLNEGYRPTTKVENGKTEYRFEKGNGDSLFTVNKAEHDYAQWLTAQKASNEQPSNPSSAFSPDDTLIMHSPHSGEDSTVSYRGPLGDKAVVWTGKTQMTVPMDWLRREGESLKTAPKVEPVATLPPPPAPKPPATTKSELIDELLGPKPSSSSGLWSQWVERKKDFSKWTKERLLEHKADLEKIKEDGAKRLAFSYAIKDEIEPRVDAAGANWRSELSTIAKERGDESWVGMSDNSKGEEIARLSSRLYDRSKSTNPTQSTTPAEGQSTASNSWEIPEKDAAEMRRLLKQKKTALLAGDGERVDSLEDKIDALKAKNPNPNVSKDTPTPATTPAEGQSAGGVVEGEKAPTAQEWKALYEEHQALLAASKDNPQAWKPQEWQAHRSALMKREANSRKVPAVWSHNELITATGKYELDHETGELTKLQPLSEIGFLRNVDSLFKDSIPESGIDGGNDLARKLWAKVKAERAEGEQRKADAAAKAQAESKVKAEEQAKLDATATERRAAFVATIGTPKFKAVKYTDLAGNVFGGQQLGNWVIYKPKGSSNYSIVDEPSKMGVNGLLQDRNVSQADAREIAAWLNRANEGFSGELAKNTDQLGKLRATLTAWRDGGAPAWFKGKAEAPESVKPDEITSSDLPQVGDRVSWIDDSGHKAVSTIERISDGKGRVDHFGMKFVDMSRFTLEKKSTARLKREGIVETPATPKETDKPPASSDVVKSPKLQSPNSDEYWSYNTLVKWMTDNGIPVDMTREEYEGEVARRKGIIEPPVHDTTQAGTAQMREQGGYEEYIKNEPRSFREKVWPEALQIVGKEPFKGTELVKELLDSPRALEDTERAILTHESLRRQKAYDKSIDDLIAAKPEDYAAAEKKMMAAREAHQEGLEALDMAGSKAGSALGAIRLMIKNDFSLGRLERRFRAALGPKPTPEEIKEADAKAAELAKVIKKNDELTEQIRSQLDEIAGLKAAMKAHEHGLTPKADRKVEIKEEDDALARLKSRRKLSSGDVLASPSPEDDDFNDLAIFGRRFIRDGASDLTSFTTAFNAAIPGALGDNASAVYEAAKVKFKEAEDAALKDSTPTGVTNKLKVKRAEIADLKASDLNNLAMAIVQHETVKDVDTLRAKMHERLEEIFPHITEKDVSKAWTGFEKAVYPSSDPFRKLVSDLRAQEQLILKVQTLLEEERLALKSGRQPPPRTDAQRKLIREYNDLVKASGLTTSDPEKQLASNQSRIINALRNRKADLEAQVDAKKRESRANVTTPETPEMKRLRDEIAALNAKLDILDPRNTGPTEAQKIKMAESGLKKSLDNVNKEIAELERKIKTNDLSEPAPATKTSVTSPTIVQLRKALEAKRELRDDLANQLDDLREAAKPVVDPLMKVLGKWEERQNLATVKAPPRTKSRLEELSKRYLDSESPRFVQDAVALGMSLGDAEDAKLILDAERNRREEIALASMRRRVRRNIERQVARAQAFDEDSPLARKTPAEKKLDKDLTEAEFQLSLAKREALRAEEKFRLRNRTLLRKAADSAVKWRRALILADYVVLYKLGMAAGWRMAFTPTEEAIGTAISKALPGLSKNAPREFGGSVRAEAEALTQGFRYLVENFGKVLKHGVSSMDTKYSSKPDFNDLDPSLSDYIGNSHAAIKLLPKASEFYRSFRKRTEAALRNGIDATSPAAVQAIGAAAYLDAQRAIFMNPNFVSEGWRAIIGKLRKTETSPNWAKVTADVMEAAIPIVKVPTNILFEALGSYIGGILRETPFALKSAAKAATTFDGQGFAKRFNDEYSKLPPEQAEAVLRHLKKGAFGNALMLLVMLTGATASKLIGGLWTPDDKREPWQVKPERLRLTEDSKDLPRWIAHNPVFDTLHFAVTAYQYAEKAANASKAIAAKAEVEIAEAEHRMKKSNADAKDFIKAKRERDVAQKKLEAARAGGDPNKLAWAMATLSGMTTSTLALVEKAPLIGNVGQFLDAIPEDKKGDYLKKELAASAIPTGVTNIAKGEDEGADGEPIKRKMESFSDHLKNRIPGLRQTLPFKNGETDEFGFKRSETHVPIPGEKAIENFNKKNPDVKYHIPKISQASLDDLPNEVAKTAFQIRAGELLRKYSKEGIVKSEVVNDGSREEPNFVIKKTVEIPPITKEESENPTLKTIEKLKSMHRKAVTTAKSDAERPDWPLSYLDKYRSSVTK